MPDSPYEVKEIAVERPTMVLRTDSSQIFSAAAEGISFRTRIFLLSPANVSGIKGQRLLNPTGDSDLALRLRNSGAPLGEVYRFISSLYFRGKLDYARRFQNPPRGVAGVQIITGAGLMLPETVVTLCDLRRISPRQSTQRTPIIDCLWTRICCACESW